MKYEQSPNGPGDVVTSRGDFGGGALSKYPPPLAFGYSAVSGERRVSLEGRVAVVGVEVPRIHDVGPVLLQEADRFPEFFQGQIPELAALSRTLRTERELSFYGDEQSGIPAADLYTPQDAEAILRATSQALTACRNLLAR